MMPISRREQGLAVFFLVALAWGLWNYRGMFQSSPPPSPDPLAVPYGATSDGTEAVVTQADSKSPSPSDKVARPDWGDDPFIRPWRQPVTSAVYAAPVKKSSSLHLTAIVVRPTQRYAVINGIIVREGQQVAGRRITRIEASRVLVDDNGIEVILTL